VRRNRLENDEVHIIDVGSLNGTYVNRQASESAVLVNGDEVQIGKFRVSSTTLDVLPADRPRHRGSWAWSKTSGKTRRRPAKDNDAAEPLSKSAN
jgi:hypothetical protein